MFNHEKNNPIEIYCFAFSFQSWVLPAVLEPPIRAGVCIGSVVQGCLVGSGQRGSLPVTLGKFVFHTTQNHVIPKGILEISQIPKSVSLEIPMGPSRGEGLTQKTIRGPI